MSSHPTEQEIELWDFTKYKLGRKKAIRQKCLDCCGYNNQLVKTCSIINCSLFPYRLGRPIKVKTLTLSELIANSKECDSKKRS